AVSDAKVTVTAKDTGLTQDVTTAADGVYSVSRLAPGLYTITVEANGFSKQVLENVSVTGEQIAAVNITLQVGQQTQSVTVNGEDLPLLDTQSATISGTITNQEIQSLPTVGRDPYQLLRLTPGVFGDGAQGSAGGAQAMPGQNQGPS